MSTSAGVGTGDAPTTHRERKKALTRQALHRSAFRLATEHGVAGTTIEQICTDTGVAARTFFNYYPSKGAAILGLPDSRIEDAVRQRFRRLDTDLISRLCDLVATTVGDGSERRRIEAIVQTWPELAAPLMHWLDELRASFAALVRESEPDDERARLAVTLVMGALTVLLDRPTTTGAPAAVQLRGVVRELCEFGARQLADDDRCPA